MIGKEELPAALSAHDQEQWNEETRCNNDVYRRPCHGNAQLFPRILGHAFEPGDPPDGVQRDVARAYAETTRSQRMPQLVQYDAAKKQHEQQSRMQRPRTLLVAPASVGDKAQQK